MCKYTKNVSESVLNLWLNSYLCHIFRMLEAPNGHKVAGIHIHKRRYSTLCFDVLRISQIRIIRRTQGNGKRPKWCFIYIYICMPLVYTLGCLYRHRRGAFSVARFGRIGQCESLQNVERASELAPRSLFVYAYFSILNVISTE